MEGITTVRDGSTGEYKLGYHTLGITALTPEKKMPIPVYSRIYSSKESNFVSKDDETIRGLKFLSSHFKKNNIRTFDRGYDNNRYRVRSLKSTRNLDLLLTLVVGYIGIISEKCDERLIAMELIEYSKRIYGANKFVFYAIADGLFIVLSKCRQGITEMLRKKPKSMQISFLSDLGFVCS